MLTGRSTQFVQVDVVGRASGAVPPENRRVMTRRVTRLMNCPARKWRTVRIRRAGLSHPYPISGALSSPCSTCCNPSNLSTDYTGLTQTSTWLGQRRPTVPDLKAFIGHSSHTLHCIKRSINRQTPSLIPEVKSPLRQLQNSPQASDRSPDKAQARKPTPDCC